jgi:hypothetical protein
VGEQGAAERSWRPLGPGRSAGSGRVRAGVALAALIAAVLAVLMGSPGATARKGQVPACARSSAHRWSVEESASHPFRIWYPDDPGTGPKARNDFTLARYLKEQMNEKIWPKLTGLMGVKPEAHPQDICLVDDVGGKDNSLGNTRAEPGCNEVGQVGSTILVLDTLDQKNARDVLAHEFMHALQYSLRVKCPGTWWWRESTGEWAEDFVYPEDNREHSFAHYYTSTMDVPLTNTCDECDKNRQYGSYLWPFYIARNLGASYIGEIWRAAEHASLLDAMDSTLPGGLKKTWKRFALDAWNEDPVDYFQKWDGLHEGAGKEFGNPIDLSPGSDLGLDVGKLKHLAASYFSFKVKSGVRTVGVTIPSVYAGGIGGDKPDPHAAVQAIVELSGGSSEVQDWTGHEFKNYCFALPHQHVTGLTLVFSNSSKSDDFNDSQPAYVVATNIGCAEWHGTVSGEEHTSDGRNVKETADVTFKRAKSSPDDPTFYTPVKGSGDWQASTSGCTSSDNTGTWSVQSTDGYMAMFWNAHHNQVIPTRSYGGTLGGPFFITWQAQCQGDTSPHTTALVGFGPWNSGAQTKFVSPNGLHIQGSSAESNADGSASWHWTLNSSG